MCAKKNTKSLQKARSKLCACSEKRVKNSVCKLCAEHENLHKSTKIWKFEILTSDDWTQSRLYAHNLLFPNKMSDTSDSTPAPTLAVASLASTKGQTKPNQSKNHIAWTEARKFTLVKIVLSIRGHLNDKKPKKKRKGFTKGKRFVKVTQEEKWKKIHATAASHIDFKFSCLGDWSWILY